MRTLLISLIPVITLFAFYLYYKYFFVPVQQEQRQAKKQRLEEALDAVERERVFEFVGKRPEDEYQEFADTQMMEILN